MQTPQYRKQEQENLRAQLSAPPKLAIRKSNELGGEKQRSPLRTIQTRTDLVSPKNRNTARKEVLKDNSQQDTSESPVVALFAQLLRDRNAIGSTPRSYSALFRSLHSEIASLLYLNIIINFNPGK